MKKIYVEPSIVMLNAARRDGELQPPIVVEYEDGLKVHVFSVVLCGPSQVVYDPTREHVRVWIETESDVQMQVGGL